MKSLLSSLPFVLVAASVLQSQVNAPAVGHVRYSDRSVHTIYGLPGNYIVGETVNGSVDAASFSDGGALLATQTALLLLDPTLGTVASMDTTEPVSLVRLDGVLTTAIAWQPGANALLHWNGHSFLKKTISDLPQGSRVTSVHKLDDNTASLFVIHPDSSVVRCVVSLESGSVISSAPLAEASAFAFEDGAQVYCLVKQKVAMMSASGEILKTLPASVDEDVTVEQASAHCLHLSSKKSGREWLLHTTGNDFQLFQLPRPASSKPELVK